MELNTRTTQPQQTSPLDWLGISDQCTMSQGTYIHIIIKIIKCLDCWIARGHPFQQIWVRWSHVCSHPASLTAYPCNCTLQGHYNSPNAMNRKSNVSICWYSEYCDGQCVHLMRSTLTWHVIRVKNQPHKVVQASYEMTIPHTDLLTDFTSHACVHHRIFPQICIEVTQIRVCLLLQDSAVQSDWVVPDLLALANNKMMLWHFLASSLVFRSYKMPEYSLLCSDIRPSKCMYSLGTLFCKHFWTTSVWIPYSVYWLRNYSRNSCIGKVVPICHSCIISTCL